MDRELDSIKGKVALFVVSSGGHLQEAILLGNLLGISPDSHYVTHRNPQTLSLLKERSSYFVENIESRAWLKLLKISPLIFKISRHLKYDLIISTGAAIAVSAIPLHIFLGKSYYYFESLTRVKSPSLTGKILEFIPSIRKFSPSARNFNSRWSIGPNILESYTVGRRNSVPEKIKILVTLGTISNYRFDRLIDHVLKITQEDDQIIWQLGSTLRSDLPGQVHSTIPKEQLLELAKNSDIVFSHCGIGTLLDLLDIGVRPIVLTRLARFGEHIDDHQSEAVKIFTQLDLVEELGEEMTRNAILISTRKFISKSYD